MSRLKYNRVTLQMLKDARVLLGRKRGWTKGSFDIASPTGHAYCAIGAVRKVAGDKAHKSNGGYTPEINRAFQALDECNPMKKKRQTIIGFNDHKSTKKKDVLALFDCAIQRVEQAL